LSWVKRMSIGIWQVVLVLLIVLIIFGAGKLPAVMGDLAKGIKSFKSGLKEEDEQARADEPRLANDRADMTGPDAHLQKDETRG
jgi:sec-independent protein translocase protein TatA